MSLTNPLERLLTEVADAIAVPESAYRQAEERYSTVGSWLCAAGSGLDPYCPDVYPQGSFALGTVVKPLWGDDYDLDAVVHLAGSKNSWSPARLKAAVGSRLMQHRDYARMLQKEGRRCWTLQYASSNERHGFHLDLLPSISAASDVGQDIGDTSLAITNRRADGLLEWKDVNPRGFAEWFAEQRKTLTQRMAGDSVTVGGVAPVPTFEHQSPLQYAIQLLKRYRDVLFCEANEHAPISIIITTLVAQAYEGEETLSDTLFGVVNRMGKFVEVRGNSVRIPNPVQPSENFADRWQGDERKAQAFLRWLRASQGLEKDLLSAPPGELTGVLRRLLGDSAGRAAMSNFASRRESSAMPAARNVLEREVPTPAPSGFRSVRVSALDLLPGAPHRRRPPWEMRPNGTAVSIRGHVIGGTGVRRGPFASGEQIDLRANLRFDAHITGTRDADIYWQVTNTGFDAERADQLRGVFERGGPRKIEFSCYRGNHSIECFLVRHGECIARSGQFVVSIRT